MPNTQSLKRRIKTAGNIRQITKAMEMVSASKMRRAQSQALASRPYAKKLQATLATIATLSAGTTHPLLENHHSGKNVIILISTDKSLAGSLNTNLFRSTQELIPSESTFSPHFIIVGQKARQFVLSNNYPLIAEFSNLPDPLRYQDSQPISDLAIQGFLSHEFKSVQLFYMDFVSTLVQKTAVLNLLPIPKDLHQYTDDPATVIDMSASEKKSYLFEPNSSAILDWLLPYYVELTIFHAMIESKASEHSARMVAMKNASDNAAEIISDLTLTYNKARQASITTELLDNTTAALNVN